MHWEKVEFWDGVYSKECILNIYWTLDFYVNKEGVNKNHLHFIILKSGNKVRNTTCRLFLSDVFAFCIVSLFIVILIGLAPSSFTNHSNKYIFTNKYPQVNIQNKFNGDFNRLITYQFHKVLSFIYHHHQCHW